MLRGLMICLTVSGLSSGSTQSQIRETESTQNHLLMSSISDTVRNGATLVSRFLNLNNSTFLPFVFQNLSGKIKNLDKMIKKKGKREDNELILIMLRLMGVDSKKISRFAFDGMISFVHLMSQILLKKERRRTKQREATRDISLLRLVLSQPQVVSLLMQMQDPDLVNLILKESKQKFRNNLKEDVQCIKLLICRTKPFVRGMQHSFRFFMSREKIEGLDDKMYEEKPNENIDRKSDEDAAWNAASMEDRMYFFVPSMKEVIESGDECDRLFPDCVY